MRAGPMHDRIRIESPGQGKDGMGAPKRVWMAVWECAAEIATVSGREYFSGTREEAADVVRIRCRYHPKAVTVAADCRAVDTRRGIVYAITAVLFDDKRSLLTFICTSGVADG
jgi:head-tail adaptor